MERRERNPNTGESEWGMIGGGLLSSIASKIAAKVTGETAKKLATKAAEKGMEKIGEKTGEVIGQHIESKFKPKPAPPPQWKGEEIAKMLQKRSGAENHVTPAPINSFALVKEAYEELL